MYKGKHVTPKQKGRSGKKRSGILMISLLALFIAVAGGTLAYLVANTSPVENTFQPAEVTCEVDEDFDGTYKENVNVTNTGDINAYIRVRLLSYRVNDDGDIIGGTAVIPDFTPGAGWVKHTDGMYYYTSPVAPGDQPETPLIGKISLTDYVMKFKDGNDPDDPYGKISGDLDQGKQVIEVIAEAIQADGTDGDGIKAVVLAWGLDPESLS